MSNALFAKHDVPRFSICFFAFFTFECFFVNDFKYLTVKNEKNKLKRSNISDLLSGLKVLEDDEGMVDTLILNEDKCVFIPK